MRITLCPSVAYSMLIMLLIVVQNTERILQNGKTKRNVKEVFSDVLIAWFPVVPLIIYQRQSLYRGEGSLN